MKRRLRKAMKWTLTVLAALTLVAWVGSCWWSVSVGWNWGANEVIVALEVGLIGIDIKELDALDAVGLGEFFSWEHNQAPGIYWWFQYENFPNSRWLTVFIPLWLPLWLPFLLLAAPAAWLCWRGDRRFPETACQSCGYDISGAPHDRCPECGKEV